MLSETQSVKPVTLIFRATAPISAWAVYAKIAIFTHKIPFYTGLKLWRYFIKKFIQKLLAV